MRSLNVTRSLKVLIVVVVMCSATVVAWDTGYGIATANDKTYASQEWCGEWMELSTWMIANPTHLVIPTSRVYPDYSHLVLGEGARLI